MFGGAGRRDCLQGARVEIRLDRNGDSLLGIPANRDSDEPRNEKYYLTDGGPYSFALTQASLGLPLPLHYFMRFTAKVRDTHA